MKRRGGVRSPRPRAEAPARSRGSPPASPGGRGACVSEGPGHSRRPARVYTPDHSSGRVRMSGATFIAAVLAVAFIVFFFKMVRIVPQGFEWTVERFGKYTHTLSPGLHLLIPVMQAIGR